MNKEMPPIRASYESTSTSQYLEGEKTILDEVFQSPKGRREELKTQEQIKSTPLGTLGKI